MTPKQTSDDLNRMLAIVDSLCETPKVSVVAVCGFAGAGKTTLCNAVVAARPWITARLNCDLLSAHSLQTRQQRIADASRSKVAVRLEAEENPQNWYDWREIKVALQSLRKARGYRTNNAWNKNSGKRDAAYSLSLPQSGPAIVLCDCIYLLHDPVRDWFNQVLLLQAQDSTLEERRALRSATPKRAKEAKERWARFEKPYFDCNARFADQVLGPRN